MLRYKTFRSALICLCTLLICCPSFAGSERIPSYLHEPGKLDELRAYYRERLVDIHITVREIKTNKEVVVDGTGFLISSAGDVITAKHVIAPVMSSDQYRIERADYFKIFLHENGL